MNITLADASAGALIYYTTDGSIPTALSEQYTAPITPANISAAYTVKALAVVSGSESLIASATYDLSPLPTPTISPESGTYIESPTVTMSDSQAGVSIYYTTDGSMPTASSTKYAGPFVPASSQIGMITIQAIAYEAGLVTSAVSSAEIVIDTPAATTIPTPVISPASGHYSASPTVTISDSQAGVSIYYTTNGHMPTVNSKKYTGPFVLSSSQSGTVTILAIANESGSVTSDMAKAQLSITPETTTTDPTTLPMPAISPASGSFTASPVVTMSDAQTGASIYYTTDGSMPTSGSTRYTGPLTLASSQTGTITIQAIAYEAGAITSVVAKAQLSINPPTTLPTPVITPASGSFTTSPTVTMSDSQTGVSIYYTTDGSAPTVSSPRYAGPFTLANSQTGAVTIQAIAYEAGAITSAAAKEQFSITPPTTLPTPVITPASGSFITSPTVTMSDSQTEASIYYTTDGSIPTVSSPRYTGPFTLTSSQTGAVTIQAIAYETGTIESSVAVAQISINPVGNVIATTTVSSGAPLDTIPTNFLGYSHEWTVAQNLMGDAALGTNTIYRTLLGTLANNMGGPMVLRIGGGSTDTSGAATANTVEPFKELATVENVQFILGVNLGSNDLSLAEQQAATFTANLPASATMALEIGNEPDGYSTNGLRASTYGYADYLPQYQNWKQGVLSVASTTPVAGPVFGTGYWITDAQSDVVNGNLQAGLLTQHKYVACYSSTNSLATNILLQPSSAIAGMAGVQPYVVAAHQQNMTFRMDEINSICSGGEFGISDTFSATLWAIDTMFEYTSIGVDGVNWHSNYDDGAYDLFHFTEGNYGYNNMYYLAAVRPLFYGLLFFSEVAGKNAQVLNATTSTSANLKVWVTKDSIGAAHLVIINKEPSVSGNVEITLPGFSTGAIVRLSADSYQATDGITIGGQTYDGSPDGTLQGTATSEPTYPSDGVWVIPVNAMSAVMVNLQP